MHAVVVRVTVIGDVEESEQQLRDSVVPRVSQAPGFVSGTWTRAGTDGLAMVVFESEDAARQMADRVPEVVPPSVSLQNVEVREVVASA